MMKALQGSKTYICVIAGVVVVALRGLDYIDDATFQMMLTLLGFGTAAALRSGISKLGSKN